MKDLINWALGILFTLIMAAFGYAYSVDSSVNVRIEKSENRVIDRLDRLEDRLERLFERGVGTGSSTRSNRYSIERDNRTE